MTLAAKWIPLLNAIELASGIELKFITASNIPAFEACLLAGEYDAAYMNPAHYVLANQYSGYRAFARAADKLRGIIVVHEDSAYRSLRDLEERNLAIPAPAAFAASVIPRLHLEALGIKVKFIHSANHIAAFRNVLIGVAEAASGIERTFAMLTEADSKKLRIIYRTPAYTSHAWAVHKNVSREVAAVLAAAVESVSRVRLDLLAPLSMGPVSAATDADWNDIRSLKLTFENIQMNTSRPKNPCH